MYPICVRSVTYPYRCPTYKGSMYPPYMFLVLVSLVLLQEARFGKAELVEEEACTINGEPDYCPLTETCCTNYCCPSKSICFNDACLSYWVIVVPSVVALGILFTITLCCINHIKNRRWTPD
ncbi:uncharacterized protein LOC110463693 [Mizuhopecten yessoensis]|uniref:Uncharacterized protein n=1 Tax=Mizuhopecten yessoensis TaxID=6573 RepID=A0A210R6R8_MIZYE|nr:uncharacterized protein LOC110463693 [Mizuhopecten yessoensis]OWF56692.1 hypothetical protein KP79_PYT20148 [Mizuhopecten yessoensis]